MANMKQTGGVNGPIWNGGRNKSAVTQGLHDAELLRMNASGDLPSVIGNVLGCSRDTVGDRLKALRLKLGVEIVGEARKPNATPFLPHEDEVIIKMHSAKASRAQIAAALPPRSTGSIKRRITWLVEAGRLKPNSFKSVPVPTAPLDSVKKQVAVVQGGTGAEPVAVVFKERRCAVCRKPFQTRDYLFSCARCKNRAEYQESSHVDARLTGVTLRG